MKSLSERALQVKQSSTLGITAKSSELKSKGIDIVGFGPGEPDFETPENINEAAIKAIYGGFTKYTESSGTKELRMAICKKLKQDNNLDYDFTQIVVSNGAKHSLNNIFMAILNDGDEVLIPAPYWLSYTEIVHMAGGVSKLMYTDECMGFKITRELLASHLSDKTKAIIINSPNNPTGIVYSEEELRLIADFAVENDLYVISDEIYEKLIYDDSPGHVSIASFNDEIFKRTIVVNGLSKSYSMTGWRIGYTASNREIAKTMSNVQSHGTSNPNSIAQKAAIEALSGSQKRVEEMRVEFMKRRDYIYDRTCKIKYLSAIKPEGSFYLFVNVSQLCDKTIKGKLIKDAGDFAEILLEESNVAVVPCADFGFDYHIRLSYAISIEEIERGLNRIEKFINDNY